MSSLFGLYNYPSSRMHITSSIAMIDSLLTDSTRQRMAVGQSSCVRLEPDA